jgi:putative peptide-modifying radical SAM enzyme
MHYHIILTEQCNSECRYCYEKSFQEFDNELDKKFKFDFSAPCVSNVDVKKLKNFLLEDENPTLIFYGGEPLLQIDKIKEIIDELSDTSVRFRMQTNGKLLHLLDKKYLQKIDKILVSIDGDKERTDKNRGKGTFDILMKNIKKIKKEGYNGELIARMTIAQDCPDLYEQVLFLLKEFNSIHWQIDVGFYKFDFEKDKIKKFFEEYNSSVSRLVKFWMNNLRDGKIIRLYPFIGILNRLLGYDCETRLQCGAGYNGYAIATDGKVCACPIMNNIQDFVAGNLETSPSKLKKFDIDCRKKCSVGKICGGRCLYWRNANLWPEDGEELVCSSIKHLVMEIEKNIPEIKNLLKERKITEDQLRYEKYFGPEIIP